MSTSVKSIAWLAGLLEGEANFSLKQSAANEKQLTPRITIEMSDEDVIIKAQTLMSPVSKIHSRTRKDYKPTFTFAVYGRTAIEWMMTIYPLMSKRRKEKIREIIAGWKEFGKSKTRLHNRKCNKLFKSCLEKAEELGYKLQ